MEGYVLSIVVGGGFFGHPVSGVRTRRVILLSLGMTATSLHQIVSGTIILNILTGGYDNPTTVIVPWSTSVLAFKATGTALWSASAPMTGLVLG